jgi:hypothetical protein
VGVGVGEGISVGSSVADAVGMVVGTAVRVAGTGTGVVVGEGRLAVVGVVVWMRETAVAVGSAGVRQPTTEKTTIKSSPQYIKSVLFIFSNILKLYLTCPNVRCKNPHFLIC